MKRSGSVTVFLTLMLTVLTSFITTLASNARRYVVKSEAAFATDCAIRSCFSEYDRQILDTSGIFVINSSFNSDEGGIDRIREHFSMYLAQSLTVNELVETAIEGTMEEGFEDECYTDLLFTATFESPSTGRYTITREYSYDISDS